MVFRILCWLWLVGIWDPLPFMTCGMFAKNVHICEIMLNLKTGPAKNEHIWDIAGEHNDSVTLTISSSWPPTGSKAKLGSLNCKWDR